MKRHILPVLLAVFFLCLAPAGCESSEPGQAAPEQSAPSEEQSAPSEETAATQQMPADGEIEQAPLPIPALTARVGDTMLENDCCTYAPPQDDGSRLVTRTFLDEKNGEQTQVIDLADTAPGDTEPEIRLTRCTLGSELAEGPGEPVIDAADRAFLLGILHDTECTPGDVTWPGWGIQITAGEESCWVFPSGTVSCDRGLGTGSDFARVSALAWKYASRTLVSHEGAYPVLRAAVRLRVMGANNAILEIGPKPACYKLCLTGPALHVDLDVTAAETLLRQVLDLTKLEAGLCPAPFDWEPAGTPICLTEYLDDPEDSLSMNGTLRFWLYPDGTLALQKSSTVYGYSMDPVQIETLTPGWDRPCILPGAFDWNTLITALEALAA